MTCDGVVTVARHERRHRRRHQRHRRAAGVTRRTATEERGVHGTQRHERAGETPHNVVTSAPPHFDRVLQQHLRARRTDAQGRRRWHVDTETPRFVKRCGVSGVAARVRERDARVRRGGCDGHCGRLVVTEPGARQPHVVRQPRVGTHGCPCSSGDVSTDDSGGGGSGGR